MSAVLCCITPLKSVRAVLSLRSAQKQPPGRSWPRSDGFGLSPALVLPAEALRPQLGRHYLLGRVLLLCTLLPGGPVLAQSLSTCSKSTQPALSTPSPAWSRSFTAHVFAGHLPRALSSAPRCAGVRKTKPPLPGPRASARFLPARHAPSRPTALPTPENRVDQPERMSVTGQSRGESKFDKRQDGNPPLAPESGRQMPGFLLQAGFVCWFLYFRPLTWCCFSFSLALNFYRHFLFFNYSRRSLLLSLWALSTVARLFCNSQKDRPKGTQENRARQRAGTVWPRGCVK